MIHIIDILDRQDAAATCDMAYGRHLIETWDEFIGPVRDSVDNIMSRISPEDETKLITDFNTQCDEKGYAPDNDDVRYTYLVTLAREVPPYVYILFLQDMYVKKSPLLAFNDERAFFVLLGYVGRVIATGVLQQHSIEVRTVKDVEMILSILNDLLK